MLRPSRLRVTDDDDDDDDDVAVNDSVPVSVAACTMFVQCVYAGMRVATRRSHQS